MDQFSILLAFLKPLEQAHVSNNLSKFGDAIMVDIAVPPMGDRVLSRRPHRARDFDMTDDVEEVDGIDGLNDLLKPWADLRATLDDDV